MDLLTQYFGGFFLNTGRYFILAGIPFLIFYKLTSHKYGPNRIQKKLAKKKDFFREIKNSLLTAAIFAGIGIILLKTPFRKYTQIYDDINDYSLWWIPLSLLLAFIINDTYFYWMHRLAHHPLVFKIIHLTHHKSTKPNPWTSYSFSFAEGVLESLVGPIIFLIIPLHPLTIFIYALFSFVVNVYGHLGFEIAPRWLRKSFLFEIITTSVHHNLHHEKFKGNYGLYFRFWDRLLKTEHPDYVAKYDEIQRKRFGKNERNSNWTIASLGIGLLILLFSFSLVKLNNIEGICISEGEAGKALVEIYKKEDGKIYGKLIKVLESNEPERVKEKKNSLEICILSKFEFVNDKVLKNGEIYLPSKDSYVDGEIEILNEKQIIVTGTKRRFSKLFIWNKKQ